MNISCLKLIALAALCALFTGCYTIDPYLGSSSSRPLHRAHHYGDSYDDYRYGDYRRSDTRYRGTPKVRRKSGGNLEVEHPSGRTALYSSRGKLIRRNPNSTRAEIVRGDEAIRDYLYNYGGSRRGSSGGRIEVKQRKDGNYLAELSSGRSAIFTPSGRLIDNNPNLTRTDLSRMSAAVRSYARKRGSTTTRRGTDGNPGLPTVKRKSGGNLEAKFRSGRTLIYSPNGRLAKPNPRASALERRLADQAIRAYLSGTRRIY